MTPGQVAYEAYSEAVGGASAVTGTVLPSWAGQRPDIREAWEVAADAVRRMRPTFVDEPGSVPAAYRDGPRLAGNPGGGDPVIGDGFRATSEAIVLPPNTPQPG